VFYLLGVGGYGINKLFMKKLLILVGLACLLASCSTVSTGSDPVIVGAEKTRSLATITFTTLWQLEKDNRLALWAVSHDFKHQTDFTRTNAPLWVADLTGAIAAYKAVKGPTTQQLLLKSEESLLGHATDASKLSSSITNAIPTLHR